MSIQTEKPKELPKEIESDEKTKMLTSKTEVKQSNETTFKSVLKWILKYLVSTMIGFIFGYAMEKAKVYEPVAIRQQMIFNKFIMLKMFLAALCMSVLSILLIALIFKNTYINLLQSGKNALSPKSPVSLVAGGLMIGIGMQISGSCPGMVLVQLGAGVPWSYITFIGCLAGALAHGLLSSHLASNSKSDDNFVAKTAFEILQIPATVARCILIAVLALIVFGLEFYFPWTQEYKGGVILISNVFVMKAWPPFVCGILLGSLQFASILFLEKSLGASSFYSSVAGLPICTKKLQESFPYLAKFRSGLQNWLALSFSAGSVLGAAVSSVSSGVFATAAGVHPYNAFLGGFIMVLGARIAGGCTSGHGISGCSHQYIGSFITTAAMFGGAIAIAFYALTNDFFF